MRKRSRISGFRSVLASIVLLAAPLTHAAPLASAGGVEHWLGIAKTLAPAGTAIDFTPHATQPGSTPAEHPGRSSGTAG